MQEKRNNEVYLGEYTEKGISRISYKKIRRGEPRKNEKGELVFPIFVLKDSIED